MEYEEIFPRDDIYENVTFFNGRMSDQQPPITSPTRTMPIPAPRTSLTRPSGEPSRVPPVSMEGTSHGVERVTTSADQYANDGRFSENRDSRDDPCSWLDEPLYQLISFMEPSVDEQSRLLDEQPRTSSSVEVDGTYEFTVMDFVRKPKPTLWTQVTQVIDSGLIGILTKEEIEFQEAKFEILTSEASYLKSLNLLKTHFTNSEKLNSENILSKPDHGTLFSAIKPVRKCSKAFLTDLERCWEDNILLHGIFDVIYMHAHQGFKGYVTYCSKLMQIQEKHDSLMKEDKFREVLESLEKNSICHNLKLDSFLLLPLTRITKLPLLLDKALEMLMANRQNLGDLDYDAERDRCLNAVDAIRQVTETCNRDTLTHNRLVRMIQIQQSLVFPPSCARIALVSPGIWFVKSGEVKQVSASEMRRRGNSPRPNVMLILKKGKATLTLFLLNNMLILTEKSSKSENSYVVSDYCSRDQLLVARVTLLPTRDKFQFRLTLKENHEKKWIEMIMSCSTEKERDVWIENILHKDDANKIAPKEMVCVHPFRASDPGHLFLQEGHRVTVTKILDNGWYEGDRQRGNGSGSFPPSRVADIKKLTEHVSYGQK